MANSTVCKSKWKPIVQPRQSTVTVPTPTTASYLSHDPKHQMKQKKEVRNKKGQQKNHLGTVSRKTISLRAFDLYEQCRPKMVLSEEQCYRLNDC